MHKRKTVQRQILCTSNFAFKNPGKRVLNRFMYRHCEIENQCNLFYKQSAERRFYISARKHYTAGQDLFSSTPICNHSQKVSILHAMRS